MAIVAGRKKYADECVKNTDGEKILRDINIAYSSIDTFTNTMCSLGITDLIQLPDVTYE